MHKNLHIQLLRGLFVHMCTIYIRNRYYRFLPFPAAYYGQTNTMPCLKNRKRRLFAPNGHLTRQKASSNDCLILIHDQSIDKFCCRSGISMTAFFSLKLTILGQKSVISSIFKQALMQTRLKIDIKAIPRYFQRYRLVGLLSIIYQ